MNIGLRCTAQGGSHFLAPQNCIIFLGVCDAFMSTQNSVYLQSNESSGHLIYKQVLEHNFGKNPSFGV